MKNTNTLYFIHNEVLKTACFEYSDNTKLMYLSDLVIANNKVIKARQQERGTYISDEGILAEINSFDGIVISRPYKETNPDKEHIQKITDSYISIQKYQCDPLINNISYRLRLLYPAMDKNQSDDWSLEFVNSDGNCEDVFDRMDNIFITKPKNYVDERKEQVNEFDKFFN